MIIAHESKKKILGAYSLPANTGHSPNAVSILGQCRRRWANIETALGGRPVFAGLVLNQCSTAKCACLGRSSVGQQLPIEYRLTELIQPLN